jgi:hypothetical protein
MHCVAEMPLQAQNEAALLSSAGKELPYTQVKVRQDRGIVSPR